MATPKSESEVLGFTVYDRDLGGHPNEVFMRALPEKVAEIPRGTYVTIEDGDRTFIGRVIDGPYTVREGNDDRTYFVIELVATLTPDGQTGVFSRPPPNREVQRADPNTVGKYIGCLGDIYIGRLATQFEVPVQLDSSTLIRHVAIFGTTGAGKSNTLQVIVEECLRRNFAVLCFDVEGEYVAMDQPTDILHGLLTKFGYKPEGVSDFRVLVPFPCSSLAKNAQRFTIPFQDIDKNILCEIVDVHGLHRVALLDAIEEVSSGFKTVQQDYFFEETEAMPYRLSDVIERIKKKLNPVLNPDLPQYLREIYTSLLTKLYYLSDLKIFDQEAETVAIEEIVKAGRLTVVDISEATDDLRNIVIAYILKKLFEYKMRNPDTPRIGIVLEEAHTFISESRKTRMIATATMLFELARRGRKRGICLFFVSQQPAHLPTEIFELCNTRFIHRISSTENLEVVQRSTGGVPRALWQAVTSLGRGECLLVSPKFHHAVVVKVRPAASKRLYTE